MAKSKTRHAIVRYRAPAAARPIVIRTHSKPAKKKHHRRRSGGGGIGIGGGHGIVGRAMPYLLGGGIVGFIDKQASLPIPTIPVLGKMGTVAALAWFFSKGQGMVGEVARAATVLAGYQLGKDGKVAGEHVEGLASTI